MKAIGKIFGIIMLAVILVGFGTAMAMWSETLRTNVYIDTGEVKVEWSDWYCSDTGPDPQAPGFNNDEGKDVASCYVEPETIDDGNVIKLNVTLVNAYPGYTVNIMMVVDNIGSIPVKLYDHQLSGVDAEALDVNLIIPSDTQIHPNENGTYILEITVLQAANEASTYSFELQLTFAQWNEV
ncbi:MAG: hypothetical protein J7L82_03785 [Staphylothermus sp.]|nr:hypothetical protein [Staphylothermus sp.]